MTTNAEQLERDILRVFRCACRQGRQDIAEFMLAALEELDHGRMGAASGSCPLEEAYREIVESDGAPSKRVG